MLKKAQLLPEMRIYEKYIQPHLRKIASSGPGPNWQLLLISQPIFSPPKSRHASDCVIILRYSNSLTTPPTNQLTPKLKLIMMFTYQNDTGSTATFHLIYLKIITWISGPVFDICFHFFSCVLEIIGTNSRYCCQLDDKIGPG